MRSESKATSLGDFVTVVATLTVALSAGCASDPNEIAFPSASASHLSGFAFRDHRPIGPANLYNGDLKRSWFVNPQRLSHHELLYVSQGSAPVLIYDLRRGLSQPPVGKINAAGTYGTIDLKGDLYLCVYDRIYRWAPGATTPVRYQPDGVGICDDIAVANDGTLYMADGQGFAVYENGQTKPSLVVKDPDSQGVMDGIAVDGSGNVYVPDINLGASPILEFPPRSSQYTVLPIQSDWLAVFDKIDPLGNIILSNLGVSEIGGPKPPSVQAFHQNQSQPFTTFDTNSYPGAFVLNHEATAIFVDDVTPNQTVALDEYAYPSGKFLGTIPLKNGLNNPYGLIISPRSSL